MIFWRPSEHFDILSFLSNTSANRDSFQKCTNRTVCGCRSLDEHQQTLTMALCDFVVVQKIAANNRNTWGENGCSQRRRRAFDERPAKQILALGLSSSVCNKKAARHGDPPGVDGDWDWERALKWPGPAWSVLQLQTAMTLQYFTCTSGIFIWRGGNKKRAEHFLLSPCLPVCHSLPYPPVSP